MWNHWVWVAGVLVCGSLPCGLLHWLRVLGFEAPDPSLFGQLVQGVAVAGDRSQFSFWIGGIHACGVEGRSPSHLPPHVGSLFRRDLAFYSLSGPHVYVAAVLAWIIVASRGFLSWMSNGL